MNRAQEAWMAAHPEYSTITSWCGPYTDSGVLYADGTFAPGSNSELKADCLIVGLALSHQPPHSSSEGGR